MEMTKYKLGDLCREFHSGKGILAADISESGMYPVFGGNGLRGYTNRYNQDGTYLIIGRQGAYCGNVRYNVGKAFLTEHAIVGQTKDEHSAIYLAFKLSLMDLAQFQGQSAQPGLSVETLSKIELQMPQKKEQDAIAKFLVELDNKIALNKKMNQKLEAMAKRLYDYWFVQFDFPDENGRPYKTSGGSMTYNETLNREIPEGWDVCGFSDFGTFKNGINYDKEELGDQTVKIVNVRNISESTTYFNIDELDDITLKTESLERFITTSSDILLARSGSPGATRLLPQTDKKVIYCGFIIRYQLDEKELDKQLYLFHVLKNYEQVTALQSAGSILKNISQDTLNALTVLNPSPRILDEFNSKIKPVYDMLSKNICELNKLAALRDKLLPLLMNGQVTIA